MTYSRLAHLLASQGHVVVVATISMFREVYEWNRENLPGYLEVYLRVPLDERRRRDPKGIYEAFARGELVHVAGLDISVDEPQYPDMVLTGSATSEIAKASQAIALAITQQETACKLNGITRHWRMPT
jgi:adenylylsulfate kinase